MDELVICSTRNGIRVARYSLLPGFWQWCKNVLKFGLENYESECDIIRSVINITHGQYPSGYYGYYTYIYNNIVIVLFSELLNWKIFCWLPGVSLVNMDTCHIGK